MAFMVADDISELIKAGLIWRAEHSWSMAADATLHFGFITSQRDMIALAREYFTFSTGIRVELFAATFTGGSAAKTINRKLALKDSAPPVQFIQGVTPSALGTPITGFELQSTSSNRVQKNGENEALIHPPQTSYVIRVTNTGTGNQLFTFSVDYREKIHGEY
ncbi:hypothetical protein [Pseudomonas sp. PSKL.D1]|uniref:hypothetical protein n=1 Tax=Pseudomonas sp. PSKL.D1 TaxID=3029060 RepID=UPI00238165B7|nr:hypothetical protein [Pseudomonas sp. PSKL.D1]WDY60382.1 hypothetical protein PVV54_12375 [Pseudomonas sp. PSKL.D1]